MYMNLKPNKNKIISFNTTTMTSLKLPPNFFFFAQIPPNYFSLKYTISFQHNIYHFPGFVKNFPANFPLKVGQV